MANHKSALKRIRSDKAKQIRNRYQHKTTRKLVRDLRNTTDKATAQELFPKVVSMLQKLAKRNIIHKNKAANIQSKLSRHLHRLSTATA